MFVIGREKSKFISGFKLELITTYHFEFVMKRERERERERERIN